jgi:predicted CXXCH cytochrome family protein
MKYIIITASMVLLSNITAIAQIGQEKKSCRECHSSLINQKVVHVAAAEECENCHTSNGNQHPKQGTKGFELVEKVPALCFMCHEKNSKVNIHPPYADDCTACHETHSADVAKLLVQKTPELCYNCHDMETSIKKAKVVHKAVTDGKGCSNCHSPHASSQEKLMLKAGKEMCLECHNKVITSGNQTFANIGLMLKKGNTVHSVIESDGCVVCHSPHISENPLLLTAAFPAGTYTSAKSQNFELCFNCHDQELLTAVTTTSATAFRNGSQNLHFLHINGEKGRNCTVCHNVHGSPSKHLINQKLMFGKWEMPIQYKPMENGGSCNTGCHAEKSYLRQ